MVATVTRLKAAATTVHYFEADGYYAKNDPEHRKASGWYGEAAATLGLHGPVKPRRFEDILAGYVPGTDIRLGRLRDGEHQHRPGVDITFSAPKSVSLEALVYAAPRTGARVVKAHDEAVRATLGFVETELLQTRSYDPATGRRPRVEADGMAAATFRHLASRNLDPQLHTHAVVANITRGRDGAWRSAEFTLGGAVEDADRGLLPQRAQDPAWRRSAMPRCRPWWAGCRGSRSRATASPCWTRSRPADGSCWTTWPTGAGRTRLRWRSRRRSTRAGARWSPTGRFLRPRGGRGRTSSGLRVTGTRRGASTATARPRPRRSRGRSRRRWRWCGRPWSTWRRGARCCPPTTCAPGRWPMEAVDTRCRRWTPLSTG